MDYSVVARSGISVAIPIYIEQLFKEIYDTVDMYENVMMIDQLITQLSH